LNEGKGLRISSMEQIWEKGYIAQGSFTNKMDQITGKLNVITLINFTFTRSNLDNEPSHPKT